MVASNKHRRAKSKRRRSHEQAVERRYSLRLKFVRDDLGAKISSLRHELGSAQTAERAAKDQAESDRAALWHLMRPRLTTELKATMGRQADVLLSVLYRQPYSRNMPPQSLTSLDAWALMRARVTVPVLTEIDQQEPFMVCVHAALAGTPYEHFDVGRIHMEVDRLGRMLAECILRKMTETPGLVAGLDSLMKFGEKREQAGRVQRGEDGAARRRSVPGQRQGDSEGPPRPGKPRGDWES